MKIFLSSTYIDLIEYRKAATIALRKQGHEVSQMEVFGARLEEPTQVAKSEISKCDVVVGIYAYRYGSIPKGSDTSITEQEYWHAKNKSKPLFCFWVNEDFPWQPKMMDKDTDKIGKLAKFKEIILNEKVVDFYTSPDNLATQIVTAIGKYVYENQLSLLSPLSSKYISIPRSSITSLPAIPYFFGREIELEIIAGAISAESRTWGVLIDGHGGIGKTALAIKAAQLAPQNLFSQKIFISAKTCKLTNSGEKKVDKPTQTDAIAILNELALELGEESTLKLTEDERATAIRLVLTKFRVLIILDNLETLDNDDRDQVYSFLSKLPEGNKAIVTSRRRDNIDARVIELGQLQKSEARKLISELTTKNHRVPDFTDDEKRELFYSTTGNPLLITWVIGQLGREKSKLNTIEDAIEYMRNAPTDNDPLEYIFGDMLSTLINREKNVLAAMTHFNSNPKSTWLSKTTDYSEKTIEKVLQELVARLILVENKETNEYYLSSLTRQFARNKLSKEISETEKNLTKHVLRLALEFGGVKNTQGLLKLAEEWGMISASLPYFVKNDENDLQILCEALDMFLKSSGLWDDWLWLNQQAELMALASENYEDAGERAYKVGLIYGYRGQPNEVFRFADRAESNWKNTFTAKVFFNEKPYISYLRGIGHSINKNYPMAIRSFNEALEIWKITNQNAIEVATVLNSLGEAQIASGETSRADIEFNDAKKSIEEALSIATRNNYKEGITIYTGNLAIIALKNYEWVEAEKLASDALKFAEEIGLQDEIGRQNFYLAKAYLNLGYGGNRGLVASRKAVEIFTRLRHKELQAAQELLDEWSIKLSANKPM